MAKVFDEKLSLARGLHFLSRNIRKLFEIRLEITPPKGSKRMKETQTFGNWKIVNGDQTILKVVGFPGGESMWVIVTEGNDHEGLGRIDNHPIFSDLVRGDLIAYGNGTDEVTPEFIAAI